MSARLGELRGALNGFHAGEDGGHLLEDLTSARFHVGELFYARLKLQLREMRVLKPSVQATLGDSKRTLRQLAGQG